jgi:hypothetical protein
MTVWRRAAKRDATEAAIVDALQAAGAHVWRLSLPLDLLVGLHGRFVLLECKSDKRVRKDRAKQTATIAECQRKGLPVYVVRTPEDALQAIGAVR